MADFAIVELKDPFQFDEHTKLFPACLYGKDNYNRNMLYAGYGLTHVMFENKSGQIPILSDPFESKLNPKLMMTQLNKTTTIVSWIYRISNHRVIETFAENASVCFGDSGGELG